MLFNINSRIAFKILVTITVIAVLFVNFFVHSYNKTYIGRVQSHNSYYDRDKKEIVFLTVFICSDNMIRTSKDLADYVLPVNSTKHFTITYYEIKWPYKH